MNDKVERRLHVEIESIGMYSILKADGDPKTVEEFLNKLNADEYMGTVTSGSSALLEAWTGRAVGKMHNNRISFEEVAGEMGVTRAYISMILNGKRKPPDARKRVEGAIDAIIERRAEDKEGA